jgi:hypothetical protein
MGQLGQTSSYRKISCKKKVEKVNGKVAEECRKVAIILKSV